MFVHILLYIYIHTYIHIYVAQMVKSLPAVQETWVQSLDWEDPPEEGMATHSSILSWRIPGTELPGGLQSIGLQKVRCDLGRMHQWLRLQASTVEDVGLIPGWGTKTPHAAWPKKFSQN